jgi:ABC-type phosphate/phosphonate transport system ATPase subunit
MLNYKACYNVKFKIDSQLLSSITFKLKDVNELQIGGIITSYGNVEIVSIYIDRVIGLSHR